MFATTALLINVATLPAMAQPHNQKYQGHSECKDHQGHEGHPEWKEHQNHFGIKSHK
ncbi:hypothetical protein I8748_30375 [Nostoc sp. CENA67]|uniref:Uncharacterized protein n=1 Tax=Amazonocrinis nigriterrae CENA67 TaxID=2794033 RepID=A0A8J7LC57_9NOST|nr:hypothetical protein [Amazonocrinis nigriterrae]MBH8566410.1 hypothetical protein [Amazonocrinis nigriterrae CENA67]